MTDDGASCRDRGGAPTTVRHLRWGAPDGVGLRPLSGDFDIMVRPGYEAVVYIRLEARAGRFPDAGLRRAFASGIDPDATYRLLLSVHGLPKLLIADFWRPWLDALDGLRRAGRVAVLSDGSEPERLLITQIPQLPEYTRSFGFDESRAAWRWLLEGSGSTPSAPEGIDDPTLI